MQSLAPSIARATEAQVQRLVQFMAASRRLVVLSGAGISTESGIPDYRSPGRPPYRPLQDAEFVGSDLVRRRYWARSMVGFPKMSAVRPNATHSALAALERDGYVAHIVTQNVDRLHHKAGSQRVVELHGNLQAAECMACHTSVPRSVFQRWLVTRNTEWVQAVAGADFSDRPDFDVELGDADYAAFVVPPCPSCGGSFRPSVVFHGGCVPQHVSQRAADIVRAAGALLVLGTSLTVHSSFRLVRIAADRATPTAIVNVGPTRADALVPLKLEALCSDVLPRVRDTLPRHPGGPSAALSSRSVFPDAQLQL